MAVSVLSLMLISVGKRSRIFTYTKISLYLVCYNAVLDITRTWLFKIPFPVLSMHFTPHYNTVWIANKEIGLDLDSSVIKRL